VPEDEHEHERVGRNAATSREIRVRIVVAGEALVDLVPDPDGRMRALPGGSPFNVAVGLGRLGADASSLGALSSDAFGDLLAARLADAGVAALPPQRTTRPTTLAMVHLDAAGHATYGFYLEGTSATGMSSDDLQAAFAHDPDAASAALHVSLGAVTLRSDGTGTVLRDLLASGAQRPLVTFDPNVRPAVMTDLDAERAAIEHAVTQVDVVKVSDADLLALHPGSDPLSVAGDWARSGPALVVVTRGADGAVAVRDEGGMLTVAGQRVDVVDTVGAGDAFSSGLLASLDEHGLLERDALRGTDVATLRSVLAFAAEVAAITCTREGADPPRRAELGDR
jgi:fructokinase